MTTPDVSAELEAATQRVRELGEQVAEQARKNGLAWLEGYETVLKNMLDLEEQAAKGTGAEWATTLAATHANFVRSTSEVVLGALRQQLKAGGAAQGLPPDHDGPGARTGAVPCTATGQAAADCHLCGG